MHPESAKTGGFFTKVMHMVRGSTAAIQQVEVEADADNQNAHQVLQEVVERKRRNDAIRQQEFAHLRQLRRRHEVQSQPVGQAHAEEEFLPSLLGQETRSTETLQKIDAIEAQMSGQWWQSSASSSNAEKPIRTKLSDARQLSALPVLGEETVAQPQVVGACEVQDSSAPASLISGDMLPVAPQESVVVDTHYEPSADLEEAAILFAHGDIQGAKTRLLEQLVQLLSLESPEEDRVIALWHAAMDLCRAVGDEEAFEPLAIDYAQHFGRSAPLWNSMPAFLGIKPLYGSEPPVSSRRRFQWSAPSMLTVGAINALKSACKDAPQPWSTSWLRLASIDEVALPLLSELLNEWANADMQFVMSDAGKLLQLLAQKTAVGDATVSQAWWSVHMGLLRVMNRMEAYEQVALDFCITYELSPPSWTAPQCYCLVQEEGEPEVSILQEVGSVLSVQGVQPAPVPAPAASQWSAGAGLSGVIEGDAQPWLDALNEKIQAGQVFEVVCDKLIRLDFVAAGSVLNWAADMQSKGVELKFTKLHQLVAVFFCVIGIQEHAVVQPMRY